MGFGGMQGMSATLNGLSAGSQVPELDLSPMRSDLVASATEMFVEGWSDAVSTFEQAVSGLTAGVDETTNDFVAGEQAHLAAAVTGRRSTRPSCGRKGSIRE